jgi:uncharacterized membrane protein YedE/YeeE
MKANVASFVAGLLFAVGLALAGMGQPSTVVGFLDFFGRWNPSLALLMMAGIPVVLVAHLVSRRRAAPLLAERFPAAPTAIDGRLLAGAAIFGVGWGLAGICPGPALLALAAGLKNGALLVAGMIVGIFLFNAYDRARQPDETGSSLEAKHS